MSSNAGKTNSGSEGKVNKPFVIDTNVFIHRPDALFSFKDSEVVVPLWVL